MEYDSTPVYRILAWLILAALLYLILFAQAINAQVVITEAYPAPPTGEPEWIELYNAGSESAALAGWTLEDQLTTPSLLKTFTTEVLAPAHYLVIELTTAKLNNGADGVTLKNATGAVQSAMAYTSSEIGQSWSLVTSNWLLGPPTPGVANPQPTPSPSPSPSSTPNPSPSPTPSPTVSPSPSPLPSSYPLSLVSLAEIYACPDTGESEWLKLVNTSSQLIDLAGWKLKDSTTTIVTYTTESIAAHGSLVTQLAVPKLNNTGDTITLEAPNGSIAFEESYLSCIKGQSLVKVAGEWRVPGASPTPSPSPTANSTSSSQWGNNSLATSARLSSAKPGTPMVAGSTSTFTPSDYSPQLMSTSTPDVLSAPPLNLAAAEPDIIGASSAIIGGLLLSASNGLWLLRKLPHVENLP